jgi:hypothetical protein
MREFIKRVATDRITGDRPAAPRALGAAVVAGTVIGVLTYRLLRR